MKARQKAILPKNATYLWIDYDSCRLLIDIRLMTTGTSNMNLPIHVSDAACLISQRFVQSLDYLYLFVFPILSNLSFMIVSCLYLLKSSY